MTAPSERIMKLMAYADGELEGDERTEVEKMIASDGEAARIVAQMTSLGDFVRVGYEDAQAKRVASVDFTSDIMAAVEKEKIDGPPPRVKVASLDAARTRRRTAVAVAVGVLALAASIAVVMRQKEEAPIAQGPGNPSAPVNASVSGGVEVEAVESPGQSVSVFYLPTGNELSTSVVVWVDETGEK